MQEQLFPIGLAWACADKWSLTLLSPALSDTRGGPKLDYVGAVLFQSRCQANWKLVIMRVYDKPADSGYTSDISFELRMETINAYDLRSYIMLLEQ